MAPVPIESLLPPSQWPASLAHFVTWCLMWDPRNRPTSIQALQHEFFRDAVDPLMPRAVTPSRLSMISKKSGELSMKASRDSMIDDSRPTLDKKPSWFRKSFIGGRSDGVLSPPPTNNPEQSLKQRIEKRSTWHAPKPAQVGANGAPIMILPSIKPVSPLSDTVSVQAAKGAGAPETMVKKLGRQLSVASTKSQDPHYNAAMQQTVDKLNGNVPGAMVSPTYAKEGFMSHWRKRVRRLSGRAGGLPPSPNDDDLEAGVGCVPWGGAPKEPASARNSISMINDTPGNSSGFDKAISEVNGALGDDVSPSASAPPIRRNISFPPTPNASRAGEAAISSNPNPAPNFPKTRRSCRNNRQRYETPDENDELCDEVLAAASGYASRRTSAAYDVPTRQKSNRSLRQSMPIGYPTPSPQKYYPEVKTVEIHGTQPQPKNNTWPTPPSDGTGNGVWGPLVTEPEPINASYR